MRAVASAALRLFGTWPAALAAAGLDPGRVSRYRRWDDQEVLRELKRRARRGEPLNSGAIQREGAGLYEAAVRRFGDYDAALRRAGVDPDSVRRRRVWDRAAVVRELRAVKASGGRVDDGAVRRRDVALYRAAVRHYGSFAAARAAARVRPRRGVA